MDIGNRIKNRRIELGLTQEELAQRLGYTSKTTIAKIEANKNQLRQSKIKDIADALETTPDYIMGWTDEVTEDSTADILGFFTDKELDLVKTYRELDDEGKRQLVLMLAFLKSQDNK